MNGRERPPSTDVAQLRQLYGTVNPGRHWLNAQGIGGDEGRPAQFNLPAAPAQARGGGGSGYNRTTPGVASHDGSSVMSGNC